MALIADSIFHILLQLSESAYHIVILPLSTWNTGVLGGEDPQSAPLIT